MNNLGKCIFCSATITVIGINLYCNCCDNCKQYNPYNESYIRKPTQQNFSDYGRWQLESVWTSASGTTNTNIQDYARGTDNVLLNNCKTIFINQ